MKISCAFGPSSQTPDHIALAEELGYDRAWVYDSPAVYLDAWATLAVAAGRTERIGLGTAVVTPSLRHPMVTAAAVSTIEGLAPGRVALGIGAGASARWLLGRSAMRWADVEAYVVAVRGLLRGEQVQWDGTTLKMVHPAGWGPSRPIDVPIMVGAEGPKGMAVARQHGDGVSTFVQTAPTEFDWIMRLVFGTVLDEGEAPDSDRVVDAAGAIAGLGYHATYEWQGPDAVLGLPNGAEWLEAVRAVPEPERHLTIHNGHGVVMHDIDRRYVPRDLVAASTWVVRPGELRARVEQLVADGVTEVTYQPGGGDVPRELRTFAEATMAVRV
ncbi:LLM class flavin-dependent oxidoreductase [Pseudonocardia sp. GCM10023141]|uniref:LLM class flavin-dependent oxidoreductase n=1 Tax=Pseudonocardia sp. GCM10023141 TaxID=3252653 RepID=UPI00360E88EE